MLTYKRRLKLSKIQEDRLSSWIGNNRLTQSDFVCTNCGHVSHADINAAKNIMSKGIALNRKREALACALVEKPRYFRDESVSVMVS